MSPIPVVTHEPVIHSSISSDEQTIHLGSLTVDSRSDSEPPMSIEHPTVFSESMSCSPTQIEHRYQRDNRNGVFGKFLGCYKSIFSTVNQWRRRLQSLKMTNDDWEIPLERINTDLSLIAAGIEGTVFHSKLNRQDIACKRVKTKEETNIKHLKNFNHINVIQFRGISIAPPVYYIVMEYCAYGSLYDVLKRRREKNSWTKATQVLDWSRQIANGMAYLHSHHFVHRDLKSPNILFFDKHTLKISDFGTSKRSIDQRSQSMAFTGTAAWLAPEVIRNEFCSNKIDVWSFGVVLWEIFTCAVPYNNIDPNAVIWGVGKGNLTLPIPLSTPEGLKSLMNLCWNQRPFDRPSFEQIIEHLNSNENDITLFEQEQEYAEVTRLCSTEITEHLPSSSIVDLCPTVSMTTSQLLEARREEFQTISSLRSDYQTKAQQVNTLRHQLSSLMMDLEERERRIKEKEQMIRIRETTHRKSNSNVSQPRRKTSFSSRKESSTDDLSTGVTVIPFYSKQDSPSSSVTTESEKDFSGA